MTCAPPALMLDQTLDQRTRPLGVLRLSLTARCNLACPYCCPDSADPPGMLTLEQQLRLMGILDGPRSLKGGCDLIGGDEVRLLGCVLYF